MEITVQTVPRVPEWPKELRESLVGITVAGCPLPRGGCSVEVITLLEALMKKSSPAASLFLKTIPPHTRYILFGRAGKTVKAIPPVS
jgi:hypothetical protein